MRPQEGGADHQPGERQLRRRRSGTRATTPRAPSTTVDPVADLSLTKTDSPDPVLAGELLTYTLTRPERRALERHRRWSSPTRCRPASPSTPRRPRRAAAPRRAARSPARSARSPTRPTRASRSRSGRRAPGTITNQAGVSSASQDPISVEQLRQRRDDGRRRPPTCRSPRPTRRTRCSRASCSPTRSRSHNAGPAERHRRDAHRHAAGRRHLRLRHAVAGHLLRVERHRRPARSARSPTSASASVEIKVTPAGPGHAHQPGERHLRPRRPRLGRPQRERRDHRRPVADLSLTKSDAPDPVLAGEQLTYTLARRQLRARATPPASQLTDTLPAGRHVRLGDALAGHLLARRAAPSPARSARSPTQRSASVEIKVTPQEGGTITNQASVVLRRGRPDTAEQLRQRRDHRRPGRRPRADQDRLARPGAGRRAAHLHARASTTPGPRAPPAVQLSDTLPAGVTFDSADALAGHLLRVERHRRLRARHARRRARPRASRSRSGRRRPARSPTARASSSLALDADTADNNASAETTVDAGRRPVADQDRLARPGAGRRASSPTRSRSRTPGPQSATGVSA